PGSGVPSGVVSSNSGRGRPRVQGPGFRLPLSAPGRARVARRLPWVEVLSVKRFLPDVALYLLWRAVAPNSVSVRTGAASSCEGALGGLGRHRKRHFVDHRRVLVRGGRGGDGVSCFHSEPRKEFGGPDGGDGGYGGHVILRVDRQVKSLSSVLSQYQGFDGGAGGRKNCFGRSGAILYIQVPVGTLVKEGNKVLADLSHPGDEFIAALGGAGGKGNRFFLANSNRAPTTCTPGQPGQERVLFLELKTVAHAGLVGFPNAGKSSLLRAISNARPTVASYPFTTLNPHVGVVHCEDHQQIAVADIPGIVRGAHQNRGLGLAFLRHIERCPFLLFVLDLSVPEPWTQLDDLKYELEQYREGLSERPHAVVANKVDLPQARAQLPQLQARLGREAIALSAATGENLEGLLLHLKELHDDHVAAELERGRQPLRW
uniref:Mitochondrial ribosome-associated GTPase 2 n=1 Tax=Phocoena sinus TaxID=42100 RepID=A0A8C9E530_PHOSS